MSAETGRLTGSNPSNSTLHYTIYETNEEWSDVVVLSHYAGSVESDVGQSQFNQMFKACPVVQYVRNGAIKVIYIRTSEIPEGFDAYSMFTHTWSSLNNILDDDFDLYDNFPDLLSNEGSWVYCNYNEADMGFPRDCGKYGEVQDEWFSMPESTTSATGYSARGVNSGLKFQIFTGSTCPSQHAENFTKTIARVYERDTGAAVYTVASGEMPAQSNLKLKMEPGFYIVEAVAKFDKYSDSGVALSTLNVQWLPLPSPYYLCRSRDGTSAYCAGIQDRAANITIRVDDMDADIFFQIMAMHNDGYSRVISNRSKYTGTIVLQEAGVYTITSTAERYGALPSIPYSQIVNVVWETVLPPNFWPEQTQHFGPVNVSIAATTAGSTIYYTTDGTVPSITSTVYTEPLLLTAQDTTIKALAAHADPGYSPSMIRTERYQILQPQVKYCAHLFSSDSPAALLLAGLECQASPGPFNRQFVC